MKIRIDWTPGDANELLHRLQYARLTESYDDHAGAMAVYEEALPKAEAIAAAIPFELPQCCFLVDTIRAKLGLEALHPHEPVPIDDPLVADLKAQMGADYEPEMHIHPAEWCAVLIATMGRFLLEHGAAKNRSKSQTANDAKQDKAEARRRRATDLAQEQREERPRDTVADIAASVHAQMKAEEKDTGIKPYSVRMLMDTIVLPRKPL